MKDKSVRWPKNRRSIKIQTTLLERMVILEEKDELINYVVLVIKNERPLSVGDIALYRVFKNSEWCQSGVYASENVDFVMNFSARSKSQGTTYGIQPWECMGD